MSDSFKYSQLYKHKEIFVDLKLKLYHTDTNKSVESNTAKYRCEFARAEI